MRPTLTLLSIRTGVAVPSPRNEVFPAQALAVAVTLSAGAVQVQQMAVMWMVCMAMLVVRRGACSPLSGRV